MNKPYFQVQVYCKQVQILCHTGITLHPHTGVSGTGLSIYFSSIMQLLVSLHPFSGYCSLLGSICCFSSVWTQ